MIKKCLLLFLLLFAVGSVSAETYYLNNDSFDALTDTGVYNTDSGSYISAYVIINAPGEYILNYSYANYTMPESGVFIFVNNTENVSLDCNYNWFNSTASYDAVRPVYVYNSTNVTVKNLKCNGFYSAVEFENSVDCVLTSSNFTSIQEDGIYLKNTNNTEISDCIITSLYGETVFLTNSYGNTISGCTMTATDNDDYAVLTLDYSENNLISDCVVTAVDYYAIGIYDSNNNTVLNSVADAYGNAIDLEYSNNCIIRGCTATATNAENAIAITWYSDYNIVSNCTAISVLDGRAIYVGDSSSHAIIVNCNATAYDETIYLSGSDYNNIVNCNATTTSGDYAYYMASGSDYNNITDCNATAVRYAIYLSGSDYNNIVNSNAVATLYYAYEIVGSDYNNIVNCTATAVERGIRLGTSNYNNIITCNISASDWFGVEFSSSANYNNISNCVVTSQNRAIYTSYSYNNLITGSTLNSDNSAIYRYYSYDNRFYMNNINGPIVNDGSGDSYFISETELNYIYNGELYTSILGNYWYDYNETELNASNINGIWNVSYAVAGGGLDSYPLFGVSGKDIFVFNGDFVSYVFTEISENLTSKGISNNLNKVNSTNYDSFEGLYFGMNDLGNITFTESLNLSDSETQEFLLGLESKFNLTDGRIAFNVTDSELSGIGAEIEFYNIDDITYSANVTADDIYEYLVAFSDNGTSLDVSELVTGYELDGTTFRFNVTHFTIYEVDYDDGMYHITEENFTSTTPYSDGRNAYVMITEPGYYILECDFVHESSSDDFIVINSDNVTFDGNGHWLNSSNGYLVYSSDETPVANITVKNLMSNGDIYLYASNSIISSNMIYYLDIEGDYNKLVNNILEDGIYTYGLYTTISSNNVTDSSGYAIDFDGEDGEGAYATIFNNTVLASEYGIRLDDYDEDYSNISYNTVHSSEYPLIIGEDVTGCNIYLNNFIYTDTVDISGITPDETGNNSFLSPFKIEYKYNGNIYSNFLGNYWSNYNGTDADGNGIGDTYYLYGCDDEADYLENDTASLMGMWGIDLTPYTAPTAKPSPSHSSSGGRSYDSDISDEIESKVIKNFVSSAAVIYGNEIDQQYAEELRERIQNAEGFKISGNAVIVGGPLSNGFAKEYNNQFEMPISNDYPGENKGIIQVLKVQDNTGKIVQSYTIVYIAGSDRLGTQAALEYFKTLDELPDGPIMVEWTENGPVVVE
ncbi:parallel beta-helix repeat protein [Methanococcus maripaludis]|uniref:Parallel beta-helix repeat protein n=1 Tax=Methanococcus maripaludis TaxID=39152 RepID=A0A7J9P6E1_METMI|nr:NosD domain-containing protein [Methanococcus maripaludis]MBA2858762.1 parallel beta-helix repeat protein [Methanococcus maripaludis]